MQRLAPPSASACVLLACLSGTGPALAEPFKVAFIGDQGVAPSAQQVLELIRDEGADLLLIQGDLGYEPNSASLWIENMDNILGRDFPVLIVVGNHENYEWPAYQQWQKDKLARVDSIQCEGDIGVKAYCTYKSIGVVQVAPGIIQVEGINGNDNYAQYITDKLESDNSAWRICSWHKNMRDMQAGGKGDSTGWGVYQSCLAQGALVMTGHEHSYSRTHLMSDFEAKTVIHKSNDMEIGPYSSLAVVSGLGGREIRPQLHGGDWFASIHTATQNANFGSLFCTFDNDQADCYLKDVAGLVPDAFSLTSKLEHAVSAGSDSSTAVVEEALLEDLPVQTETDQSEFNQSGAEQETGSEATSNESTAEQTPVEEPASAATTAQSTPGTVPTTVITGDAPPPLFAVTPLFNDDNASSNSNTSEGGMLHWLTLVSLFCLAAVRRRLQPGARTHCLSRAPAPYQVLHRRLEKTAPGINISNA